MRKITGKMKFLGAICLPGICEFHVWEISKPPTRFINALVILAFWKVEFEKLYKLNVKMKNCTSQKQQSGGWIFEISLIK